MPFQLVQLPVDDAQRETGPYRPLSRDNVSSKLSREYFTLLGTLSSSERGLTFFDKHHFYDNLYTLYDDQSHDYLTRLLIPTIDYGINKKGRTLLETWVKSGSLSLRHYAISQLRLLLRRKIGEFWTWGIGLLVSQLQWTDEELALSALSVLEEACQDETNLVTLIKKKPSFKAVGNRANNLRTVFLSNELGIELLGKQGLIEPLLACWKDGDGVER